MISKRTVLILGAGASADYRFPLGHRLRDLVCNIDQPEISGVLREIGHDLDEIELFRNSLRHSGYSSIDWFLEDRPEFVRIGKAAIAACLIPFENPDRIFPPSAPDNSWYELLINTLDTPLGAFSENQLSIVTFNYDRSLEHYLFRVLEERRSSQERAAEELAALNIIHVHGALGDLAPPASWGRQYVPILDPESVRMAADNITIVGEASDATEEFSLAQHKLREAERIVFLGFSYHQKSIERLAIFNDRWNDERRQSVQVGGTSRGIPIHQWNRIREDYLNEAVPARNRRVEPVYRYLSEIEPLDM